MSDDLALPPQYDPTAAESRWYRVWEEAKYFAPKDGQAPTYCIVIPPPNVTGALHMGHALTVTLQDILIRWRRMQGYRALWLPGTDHAGIATQMVVERDLKKEGRATRHDLGRERFLERVWQWKERYGNRITEQLRVMGCSLDWTRERFTMDAQLSEAVREVFVRLYEEGLLYRAERLVNWCPRCHTALSDLEVEHDDQHQGELWSFAYPLADATGEIVVATTRPETMLGDSAVAVHPDDPRYRALVGKHVRHPILGYKIPIIGDAILVDPEFGTGAVKVTPAHDFSDFETGKRHNLPLFNIFDANANILDAPDAPEALRAAVDASAWQGYAGLDRFSARKRIKAELAALGLARGEQPHVLPLGQCQRCETVVEPALSVQWWVRTKPLAQPALDAVRSGATRIVPEQWTKTYYHWMENIQDWCVSRQLWWGHRIPAWYCTACDPPKIPGDNPIFSAAAQPIIARAKPDHCPRCGGHGLVQDSDVLDTWFSSALWPFSTLGWPKNTDDLRAFYPNAVMETGFDILFFWVARMMMMGCHVMGRPPFPTIYLHAMVRDRHGDKMSKTRGNVIDPLHLIHGCGADEVSSQFRSEYPEGFPAFGADALRFTLAAMSVSGRDIKLSVERIAGYRAFANKIWNAARFSLMRLEGATPPPLKQVQPEEADRYILSKLATAVDDTNAALEGFRFADAAQTIYHFFWDEFCDWYIELIKPRLMGDAAATRTAAQATLVFVLEHALRLLQPMMPFLTEEIWQRLPLGERQAASIMVSSFPKSLPWRDPVLEQAYDLMKATVTALRTIRTEKQLSPSKRLRSIVVAPDAGVRAALATHREAIMHLARLDAFDIVASLDVKPAQSAVQVLERMEVVVPLEGLIDAAAERERLQRALAKTQKERDHLDQKLSNPSFVERAPADLVAKDRARLTELNDMMAKQTASLTQLAPA